MIRGSKGKEWRKRGRGNLDIPRRRNHFGSYIQEDQISCHRKERDLEEERSEKQG